MWSRHPNPHLPTPRSLIAIVPRPDLPDTVHGNITYGLALSSELTTQSNIENAAYKADIDDDIKILPTGYDILIRESGLECPAARLRKLSSHGR